MKETLNLRQNQGITTPIEHFFKTISQKLIKGALKNIIKITKDPENEDYTSDYEIFEQTVWNYIYKNLIIEGPLNFLLSTANMKQFTHNFRYFNSEIKPFFEPLVSPFAQSQMSSLFDTETFTNIY